MKEDLDHFSFIATQAALKAGEILRKGFGTSFAIDCKPGGIQNLVTEYDKTAEECIISFIQEHFPDHQFYAEESGQSENKSSHVWLIDPIDGTVNFAHSLPIFAVSIALSIEGEVVCGVIYQPMTQEMFCAIKGRGSYLNGQRLKLSTQKFQKSLLTTGFPPNVKENPRHCIDQLAHILKLGVPVRRLGSAAIDLAYVAAGRFDAFWEVSLNPWDVAAGIILIEEAGGIVTNFEGNPRTLISNDSIVGANPSIHKEMIEHLNEVKP